jgi:hypothetical protein
VRGDTDPSDLVINSVQTLNIRKLLISFVSGKLRHLFISALSVRVHHPDYLIQRYTLLFNLIMQYSYILFVTAPVSRYTLHSYTC